MRKKKVPAPIEESNEEVKVTDQEIHITDEPRLTESSPTVPASEPQMAPSEPQMAHSQVLRPTRRRNEASEPDQYLAMLTTKKERFLLMILSWITASLLALTKTALSIIITFFIAVCFNWKHGREFMEVLREPDQVSYSKLKDSIVTQAEVDESYHVTFKLTDSSFVSAAVLYEATYPLLLHNPAILFLILSSIFTSYYLLSFLQGCLLNAIDAANAQLLGRALPQEPADQPQSS